MSYELIETAEVGAGGAASIEFTSIPQDGTDLVVKVSARGNGTGTSRTGVIKFNGSSAGFSRRVLTGNGSSASSTSTSSTIGFLVQFPGSGATASTFGNTNLYISNYASSANKSFSADAVTENNATAADQEISAHIWANTAAISSIEITLNDDFSEHSTFSLYKITAA